jgi:hypothetical protein
MSLYKYIFFILISDGLFWIGEDTKDTKEQKIILKNVRNEKWYPKKLKLRSIVLVLNLFILILFRLSR